MQLLLVDLRFDAARFTELLREPHVDRADEGARDEVRVKLERFEPLMAKFGEMIREQAIFREIFGLI